MPRIQMRSVVMGEKSFRLTGTPAEAVQARAVYDNLCRLVRRDKRVGQFQHAKEERTIVTASATSGAGMVSLLTCACADSPQAVSLVLYGPTSIGKKGALKRSP
jgi:hypothetical protein